MERDCVSENETMNVTGRLVFTDILAFENFKRLYKSKKINCDKPMTVIFKYGTEISNQYLNAIFSDYGEFLDTEKTKVLAFSDDEDFKVSFYENGNLTGYQGYYSLKNFLGEFTMNNINLSYTEFNELIVDMKVGGTKLEYLREEIENLMVRLYNAVK